MLVLVLLGLLPGGARAQIIRPDPGGESCAVTPKCDPYRYEFVPGAGQTFRRWEVAGDFKLLSPDTDNPALACSAGYGKGRLTAHYYELRRRRDEKCRSDCPDTVFRTLSYDVFKLFKAPDPIGGPACALPGQTVSYAVPPRLTDWPRRAANIGTDGYAWSGFPAGTVLTYAGDSSAVTATLPDLLPPGGFRVRVQVGRCNGATPAELGVTPAQTLAAAIGQPDCQTQSGPGGATFSTVTIATQVGVTYTIGLPTGWRFANGSTGTLAGNGAAQGVHFVSDGSGGHLVFEATGGCDGPQTLVWRFLP